MTYHPPLPDTAMTPKILQEPRTVVSQALPDAQTPMVGKHYLWPPRISRVDPGNRGRRMVEMTIWFQHHEAAQRLIRPISSPKSTV